MIAMPSARLSWLGGGGCLHTHPFALFAGAADCLFEEAAEALERCSPDAFQPVELFPLFPEHTQPWLAQVGTAAQAAGPVGVTNGITNFEF